MKNIYGLFLCLFLSTNYAHAYDVTVAKDGSGTYTTVQAAVDAAPTGRTTAYTIFIKNGTYKEIINAPSNKPFLQFIGESVANVILTYDNYSGKPFPSGGTYGTSNSASTTINATDFAAVNITFENTTGEAPQALAINVNGDRCAFKNCRFLGGQDTLLANGTGSKRQYFKQCYIDGTVDFIFGSAVALFEDCTIYPKTRTSAGSSYMTAANTSAGQAYGYVFKNGIIQMNRGGTSYFLARPWQNPPSENKTVLLNTVQSGSIILPAGWSIWDALTNTALITYGEYQSVTQTGAAVDVSARVAWSQQLNATQAATYTNANMFTTWDPCTTYADMCTTTPLDIAVANLKGVKGASTSVFTWNASWGIDGVTYAFQRSTDNQVTFNPLYSVTSAGIYDVNFTYTDNNPPSGSTYHYRVVATKSGLATHTTASTPISSTPTITVGTVGSFLQGLGTPSSAQYYAFSAVNLLADATITPPANYQISTDGGTTWSADPLSISPVSGTISSRTVGVRLNSSTVGTFSGNVLNVSSGAVDANVAVTGMVQADPLPISVTLLSFPMTASNAEDAAARATGVSTATPTLSRLTTSNGTTVVAVPAYSILHGQGLGPDATGLWSAASGGTGGNLSRTHYEQFTITATSGYSARVDSLTLNAAFHNTSSVTRMAVVYSRSGFTTDSTDITGGILGSNGAALTTTAASGIGTFASPIWLTNETAGTTVNYRLALNNATGVTLAAGQTLTIRIYFCCSSGSSGRYGKIKSVFLKGLTTTAIPLSITAFSGEKVDKTTNKLTWTTASEQNNAFFSIERSDNGVDFKSIGETKGVGTSSTPQYYAFLDNNPLPNVNYYRLKQTDFDGKTSFSKIISINNGNVSKSILKVTPSVISDNLTVQIETEDIGTLHIMDAVGKTVFTKNKIEKGISTQNISTNALPNGMYFLTFMAKDGQTTTRFVKQ